MRILKYGFLVCITLCLSCCCISNIGDFIEEVTTTIPNTHTGKCMKESLETIKSGDISQISAYVSEHFTNECIEEQGEDQIVKIYHNFSKLYGGIEFVRVRESSPNSFTGEFKSLEYGSEILFGLLVRSFYPHLITEITVIFPAIPIQNKPDTNLTKK